MNVFLFKNCFEFPALAGVKMHTIRGHRRDGRPRAKVGETISLRVWTGRPYNSKQREFARAVVKAVFPIRIYDCGIQLHATRREVRWYGRQRIARNDGFGGVTEMLEWFRNTHGLPFEGVLVKWKDLVPTA